MPTAEREATDRRNLALQRAAILDNKWGPYLEDLSVQGNAYANMGIAFPAWYEVIRLFRVSLLRHIGSQYGDEPSRMMDAVHGMDRFVDVAMATLGDAYLDTKTTIIAAQQEAIREISTPVLQVRDKMLILPIIGMVDTHRARQLTEDLLQGIRTRRASIVVMDITGVPVVDSKVANHLIQSVEAARLMGATVIVTGISPQIAQTLVTIGATLGSVTTLGDLQQGIEEAERQLGLKVVSAPETQRTAYTS
jgi:rsbT co-antagonist protein RsbR